MATQWKTELCGWKLMMSKSSPFRAYVNEMYMAHKEECKWYRIPCKFKTLKTYWRVNKLFLIRKWKEEKEE